MPLEDFGLLLATFQEPRNSSIDLFYNVGFAVQRQICCRPGLRTWQHLLMCYSKTCLLISLPHKVCQHTVLAVCFLSINLLLASQVGSLGNIVSHPKNSSGPSLSDGLRPFPLPAAPRDIRLGSEPRELLSWAKPIELEHVVVVYPASPPHPSPPKWKSQRTTGRSSLERIKWGLRSFCHSGRPKIRF